jgi:hypothetical protein
MKIELIHYTIGGYGRSYYLTPCGKDGNDYYVTKNKKEVTCRECLRVLNEKN